MCLHLSTGAQWKVREVGEEEERLGWGEPLGRPCLVVTSFSSTTSPPRTKATR